MSDERLRELERAFRESGQVLDHVDWIMNAYRLGLRSGAACLSCHGLCDCERCSKRTLCKTCEGTGLMSLNEAVTLGAVFEDEACVIAAGWRPKDKKVSRGLLGAESFDGFSGEILTPTETRRPTASERLRLFGKMGATRIERRALLALMTDTVERIPELTAKDMDERVIVGLSREDPHVNTRAALVHWRNYVTDTCSFRRTEHIESFRSLAPGFDTGLFGARYGAPGQWYHAAPSGFGILVPTEDRVIEVVNAALVPYLLGHHDPLTEPSAGSSPSKVDSNSDEATKESSPAPL